MFGQAAKSKVAAAVARITACPQAEGCIKARSRAFLDYLVRTLDIRPEFFYPKFDKCYCSHCYPPACPSVLDHDGPSRSVCVGGGAHSGAGRELCRVNLLNERMAGVGAVRLSPELHLSCISPQRVSERASEGLEAYQWRWRDWELEALRRR
jgi:hypothetical protein